METLGRDGGLALMDRAGDLDVFLGADGAVGAPKPVAHIVRGVEPRRFELAV